MMKQYLLVNTDLNMSIGKTAGQAAQAGIAYARAAQASSEKNERVEEWQAMHGMREVVVGMGEEEMLSTMVRLKEDGISFAVVVDSGMTEVPRSSMTVIAIEPLTRQECPRWFKRWRTL